MPELVCVGCTRQVAQGCTAKLVPAADPNDPFVWENPSSMPYTVDEEDSFACPRQHLYQNPVYWSRILKFYAMYKQGFLPEAGAVVDQSNKAIEIFRVLDGVNAECDSEQQKESTRQRGDPFAADRRQ